VSINENLVVIITIIIIIRRRNNEEPSTKDYFANHCTPIHEPSSSRLEVANRR
jgi:hypothetical protein